MSLPEDAHTWSPSGVDLHGEGLCVLYLTFDLELLFMFILTFTETGYYVTDPVGSLWRQGSCLQGSC